jgi:hypothetical protein
MRGTRQVPQGVVWTVERFRAFIRLLSRAPTSSSPISLSDLGLRCTRDANNTVWCSTKFHDAAATNTISPIVT